MKASPRIRVLVIDDSAFSRRTIIRMLERSPLIEVADWAHDGQDALAKALEHPYDLITLDLEMPRMDGLHLPARGDEQASDAGDGDQRALR